MYIKKHQSQVCSYMGNHEIVKPPLFFTVHRRLPSMLPMPWMRHSTTFFRTLTNQVENRLRFVHTYMTKPNGSAKFRALWCRRKIDEARGFISFPYRRPTLSRVSTKRDRKWEVHMVSFYLARNFPASLYSDCAALACNDHRFVHAHPKLPVRLLANQRLWNESKLFTQPIE